MTLAALLYGMGFFMWMMSMEVASRKSWAVFDISKKKNVLYPLFVLGATFLLVFFLGPKTSHADYEHLWLVPFAVPLYYFVYVFVNRNHRENWRDSFKVDRWNGLALLGSTILATAVTIFFSN